MNIQPILGSCEVNTFSLFRQQLARSYPRLKQPFLIDRSKLGKGKVCGQYQEPISHVLIS